MSRHIRRPGSREQSKKSVRVDLRLAIDPDGDRGVLMQFQHGWIIMTPESARKIGAELYDLADRAES